MWFFLAGGAPMIFVLVFGAVALVAAVAFAARPEPEKVSHLVALGVSVLCASFAGVAADLLAVSVNVPRFVEAEGAQDFGLIVLVGFGEAMTPAIVGFTVVAVEALIVAVGLRRV